MIVPYQSLNADTLNCLIEEFVSRDGTDYGTEEMGLEQKVQQVKNLLAKGEVVILFSQSKQQANIVSADSLK